VQVIVDGRTIRTLRPGEVTPEGVKLREINGLNAEHAQRLGIDFRRGQRVVERTANGQIQEGGSDQLPLALIGMSFLKQVEMRRSGNTMTLSRPHLQ
jgi:hypothetical protein